LDISTEAKSKKALHNAKFGCDLIPYLEQLNLGLEHPSQ